MSDENYLRLYDHYGQLRLTGMEAETVAKIAAMRYAQVEARKAQALAEKLRALGIDPDKL